MVQNLMQVNVVTGSNPSTSTGASTTLPSSVTAGVSAVLGPETAKANVGGIVGGEF